MIEAGHFQELESIVSLTHRASSNEAAPVAEPKVPVVADLPVTGKANPNSEAADRPFEHKAVGLEGRADLQTFVFSATMERELQKNLKRFKGARAGSKKKQTTTLGTSPSSTCRAPVSADSPPVADLQMTSSRSSTSGMRTPRSSTSQPRAASSRPCRSRRSTASRLRRTSTSTTFSCATRAGLSSSLARSTASGGRSRCSSSSSCPSSPSIRTCSRSSGSRTSTGSRARRTRSCLRPTLPPVDSTSPPSTTSSTTSCRGRPTSTSTARVGRPVRCAKASRSRSAGPRRRSSRSC